MLGDPHTPGPVREEQRQGQREVEVGGSGKFRRDGLKLEMGGELTKRSGDRYTHATGLGHQVPGPSHLLGLGRDLGREAGAGTFRQPAVSVMRVHQLGGRQSPKAVSTHTPAPSS